MHFITNCVCFGFLFQFFTLFVLSRRLRHLAGGVLVPVFVIYDNDDGDGDDDDAEAMSTIRQWSRSKFGIHRFQVD